MDKTPQAYERLFASWVSSVADKVRNPVTGIKAAISILADDLQSRQINSELTDEALELISRRLDKMSFFVDELHELSGQRPLAIKPHSTESLWEGVRSQILNSPHRQFLGCVDIKNKVEQLQCDREALLAMIKALLFNSFESFPPDRRPWVELSIEENIDSQDGQAYVELAVADNGVGIPQEVIGQVIIPFWSSKEAGSGIGLTVVDKLTRSHQGRLHIQSVAGEGTKVHIFLPQR